MAHALGITVTAKGVGDEPTLGLLRELGCDAVTFRTWSWPVPGDTPAGAIDGAAVHAALTGSARIPPDLAVEEASAGADRG